MGRPRNGALSSTETQDGMPVSQQVCLCMNLIFAIYSYCDVLICENRGVMFYPQQSVRT